MQPPVSRISPQFFRWVAKTRASEARMRAFFMLARKGRTGIIRREASCLCGGSIVPQQLADCKQDALQRSGSPGFVSVLRGLLGCGQNDIVTADCNLEILVNVLVQIRRGKGSVFTLTNDHAVGTGAAAIEACFTGKRTLNNEVCSHLGLGIKADIYGVAVGCLVVLDYNGAADISALLSAARFY